MSDKLNELKKEATELGITYSPNIGEAKLQGKIDEFYESQETSSQELQELVEELEKEEPTAQGKEDYKAKGLQSYRAIAKEMERNARKTRIITIIDNDQRVNNQTTSCTVNCGNQYFDLGTIVLPLNEKVEVRQGHINSLKELKIPQHVKDPNNPSLSKVVQRPRYTIQYEDV